jgi:tetratricopeptide (TPR) repeat protein
VRVFISHSSNDKPVVERLADALRARGIDPWLDKWEIGAGDDIVASINAGLDEAAAGIVVFSRHSRESRWVNAEVSYLTYARIQEGKALIPVVTDNDAWVPPLLRPLARRGIEEVDAIADAILNRRTDRRVRRAPEHGLVQRVLIVLRRDGSTGVRTEVRIGDNVQGQASMASLPQGLLRAQSEFLHGFKTGLRRNPIVTSRAKLESTMLDLGRQLREVCFPEGSSEAVVNLLDGCPIGTVIEVGFEAEGADLLGLPFEALRLPDDRLLVTHRSAVMLRRPSGLASWAGETLAGPLKIVVVVAAPDEGQTASAVLDQERELQNILDAVEPARAHENAEVRVLEVGHPDVIGDALERDAYHVLHISCHGSPGMLELENEDGQAVLTTAESLIAPLKESGRPLPLVLLNACHGAVQQGTTASLAESLLRAGVPAVLAMQTAVSDTYAAQLARAFYRHLSDQEVLFASRALAAARRALERERLAAVQRGDALDATQPEYATAALFVAGDERPLANFGIEKVSLRVRPVYDVAGPVPQLRIDDLIGRRRELRETLRALREDTRPYKGVQLTGIGGVGKSSVAGRAMQRLQEGGWFIPAHVGRFDLTGIGTAIGVALLGSPRAEVRNWAAPLAGQGLDDRVRLQLIERALAEERVVLVLDDFEQNLVLGGGAFLNPDVADTLRGLAKAARRGRLLITSRHSIPGADALLERVAIGPLSVGESRKLLLRLRALHASNPPDLARVMRLVNGHPRMLEFVDALLQGGQGRLQHVTDKLQALMVEQGVDADVCSDGLHGAVQRALELGARDILLEELLNLARHEQLDEPLLQLAVSNLPVTPGGLARMLASDDATQESDVPAAERALNRLSALSLVHRFPDGSGWVHRWTAEGLARVDVARYRSRCVRAGKCRLWRLEHESHALDDAVEATRNFLAGEEFDAAARTAFACIGALTKFQQSISLAALASEVLETLPESHGDFAAIADTEAQAHLALGATQRALSRYAALLAHHEPLAHTEPNRADYQHDLSVCYNRMGSLYLALGQGELARNAYLKGLTIAERLAQAWSDRVDYQRNLSASHERLGDMYRAFGQAEQARDAYTKTLTISERLARAEPNRADYQRDLSVSYNKMGDAYCGLGQIEQARDAYEKALAIRESLAKAEPDRPDYQRDLSVSYNRIGDLYRDLGQPGQARNAYLKDLAIAERLARADPDRVDYQRDLSMSYSKMGDLCWDLGEGDGARDAYLKDLAISERLAQAEPDRADYQRDLSVSYQRVGDVYHALKQPNQARDAYARALAIAERLAQAEPDRADFQRDLAACLLSIGKDDEGNTAQLQRALRILTTLSESGRLDPVDEPRLAVLKRTLGQES